MPGSSARRAGITAVELGYTARDSRSTGLLAFGELLLGASGWIYSLALVILAYRLTGSLAWVAGILLLQAMGRLAVISFCSWFGGCARNPYAGIIGLAQPLLILSLLLVSSSERLWWALVVAGLMGVSGAIYDAARSAALPPPASEGAGLPARLLARSDQIAMVAGSLIGGLLIGIWSESAAFITAAIAGGAAALLLSQAPRRSVPEALAPDDRASEPAWRALGATPAFRRVMLALATGAALGIGLRVVLVDVVLTRHDSTELVYAVMVAFAGVGTFYSPVSVPRLLGKLGPELVLAGMIIALACSLVFIQVARPLVLIIPVIFGCGVLAIMSDRVAETLTRRLVPDGELDEALRMLAAAAVAGQALALALLLAIEPSLDGLVTVLVLAGAGIILAALMLRGYLTTGLRQLRGNELDERRPASR